MSEQRREPHDIVVVRLADAAIDRARALADIDAIFWETTARIPETAEQRAAFHELWLGQYLRLDPQHVYVACDGDGRTVGYLVGCWDNPALSPRFAGLTYFQTFAEACARYPGHLHINLTAAARSRGIGARLIDAFALSSKAAGVPGVHVVTGSAARNAVFYERRGFDRIDATLRNGNEILFLGRDLTR